MGRMEKRGTKNVGHSIHAAFTAASAVPDRLHCVTKGGVRSGRCYSGGLNIGHRVWLIFSLGVAYHFKFNLTEKVS